MKTWTLMLAAAVAAMLVLPVTAGAAAGARAGVAAIPGGTAAHLTAKPRPAAAKPKPKPPVVSTQRHGTTRSVVILPYVYAAPSTSPYAYLGGTENCASYTGCTADELCLVWGVGCERLASAGGTFARDTEEVQTP